MSVLLFAGLANAAQTTLTPVQDIWTTSVFSFAPGGGGPGGGLNDDSLRVGGWGDEYRSLLQFNLSGAPAVATSAILRLYDVDPNHQTPVSMYFDRVDSSWDWTTQPITPLSPDRTRLWWVNRPNFTTLGQVAVPSAGQYCDIDITGLYNDWQSGGVPNFGVQLRPTGNSNQWNYFGSSENAVAAWRPQLIIDAGPPPPSSVSPHPGLWWNPNESGTGYSLDFKHGVLVVLLYSFQASGAPQWYIASGPVTGNTFIGSLDKFVDGQCISCPYKFPTAAGSDGTVMIVFSSDISGTMYLPGGRTIPIEPTPF
jgi:hypothetical protein